jgi:hypothetical protein
MSIISWLKYKINIYQSKNMGDEQDEMTISIETGSNPNEIIVYFQKQNDSYTLDFEKNESNTLFQIPIEFPETVINTTTREIKNEPLTLTMLEKNDINFKILNNCLSYSDKLYSYNVEATVYIHIPNLFTVRFQISNSKGLNFIAYVSYIVSNNEGRWQIRWQIDTLNGGIFNTVTNNGAVQIQKPRELLIIQSRDIGALHPDNQLTSRSSTRNRISHINFTFNSVYEQMLNDHINIIEQAQTPGSPEPQSEKGSQTEPQSAFSPLKQAMGKMENLSIENILFNISNHTVEGLQKIANDRFNNNSPIPGPPMNLDGNENNKPKSLKQQLMKSRPTAAGGSQPLYEQKNCWRMINDTVDRAHDFIKVYDSTLEYNKNQLPGCGRFFGSLNDLVSSNGNINVPNSHSIQETNIVELHANLNENNFIIPALPKDVFVSRRFIYADFVEFLFKVSKTHSLETSRNHYAESGKQVTIDTLQSYLKDLPKDTNEEELFLRDVSLLTNNELSTIEGIIELINELTQQENLSIDKDYPTIPKNCYQRMDGCTTGPKADSELTPGNATIEGIFGLFDIELNKVVCNKDKDTPIKNKLTVTTSDNTKTKEILYQTVIDGEITLDNVVASIESIDSEQPYPFRGSGDNVKGYATSFPKIANNPQLRVLIFMALKTFCDKLYRLSMPTSTEATLTHIYTIDSYVYGDPYLQYLLGEVEYCPAVLRSASGIVNEDVLDENGNVTKNLICDTGGKTKGFWFRPSMGIDQSERGFLEKLYHRYVSYYYMLNNALKQPGIGLSTTQFFNVDTILNKPKIQSHRLNNFIERILYFYETYPSLKNNPIDNTSPSELSYDDIMGHLAYLEICKVLENIQSYMDQARNFINLINSVNPQLEEIQKFLISVPDLENTLQLSIPNLYIENQDIDVNVGESSSADKRSRDMLLHKSEIELCRDFEIQGFSEPSSGEDNAELAPTYSDVSYNDINDVITYTKNTRRISKPFTLELFIDLYNVQTDTELKNNMLQIIRDKIDTIKDLIGIKNFVCDLNLSRPFNPVEEGNEEEEEGDEKKGDEEGEDDGNDDKGGPPNSKKRRQVQNDDQLPRNKTNYNPPDSANPSPVRTRPGTNAGLGQINYNVPGENESTNWLRQGSVSEIPVKGKAVFGPGYREQPGGTNLKRKQTRRVKKKLRNTINKISKMTQKNKTKRRRKNRRKTRKS